MEAIFAQVQVNRFIYRNWGDEHSYQLSVDKIRRHIIEEIKSPPIFAEERKLLRTATVTTGRETSMMMNA